MERSILSIGLLLIVGSHANAAEEKPNDLSEVMNIDERRSAFYERAPPIMASAIRRAVESWCSSPERREFSARNEANAKTVEWLCGNQKLVYFRNVYPNGERGLSGLACGQGSKYLGMDFRADSIKYGWCVPAETEGKMVYRLYMGDVNTGDEP